MYEPRAIHHDSGVTEYSGSNGHVVEVPRPTEQWLWALLVPFAVLFFAGAVAWWTEAPWFSVLGGAVTLVGVWWCADTLTRSWEFTATKDEVRLVSRAWHGTRRLSCPRRDFRVEQSHGMYRGRQFIVLILHFGPVKVRVRKEHSPQITDITRIVRSWVS